MTEKGLLPMYKKDQRSARALLTCVVSLNTPKQQHMTSGALSAASLHRSHQEMQFYKQTSHMEKTRFLKS